MGILKEGQIILNIEKRSFEIDANIETALKESEEDKITK
jgi:hypothetical protein